MPDSGKFKDLYLNSALTYPCQRGGAPSPPSRCSAGRGATANIGNTANVSFTARTQVGPRSTWMRG